MGESENDSPETKQEQDLQKSYKPALQKHVDVNRNYLFHSVRVRIFLGEVEKDLIIRIRNQDLAVKDICSAIENHLEIPPQYVSMFRLWVFAKDIELQLDPEQKMTDLLLKWHIVMLQYTHYTEAAVAANPINRYYFVYKREAILSRNMDEQAKNAFIVAQLLYGEAKRNFLNGRYLISPEDEYKMAAYQLFNRYGVFMEKKLQKFENNPDILKGVLPARYQIVKTTNAKIIQEYQVLPDYFDAMTEFLNFFISLPCYGSCFFPVCEERPPLGYFEYRLQRWIISVNEIGKAVIDPIKKKYIKSFRWDTTSWESSPIDINLSSRENNPDKPETLKLLSPQSPIIDNVATRAKYIWAKKVLKENMDCKKDKFKKMESSLDDLPSVAKTRPMNMFDEDVEKKFTSVSQHTKKPKRKITWNYIWQMIKSPMRIKKPGETPFDINDGLSNVGSMEDLNLI